MVTHRPRQSATRVPEAKWWHHSPLAASSAWIVTIAASVFAWTILAFTPSGSPVHSTVPLFWSSPAAVVVLAVWWRGARGAVLSAVAVMVGVSIRASLGDGGPFALGEWLLLGLAAVAGPAACAAALRRAHADLRRAGLFDATRFVVVAAIGALASALGVVGLLELWHRGPADVVDATRSLAVSDLSAIVVVVPAAFVLRSARTRRRARPPRLGRRHHALQGRVGLFVTTVAAIAAIVTLTAIGGPRLDVVIGAASMVALVALAEERRRKVIEVKTAVVEMALDRARFQSFVDTTSDGVLVLDAVGRIESVNRGASRIFRGTPAQLIGRSVRDLLPAPDGVESATHLVEILSSESEGGSTSHTWEAVTLDGHRLLVDLDVSRVDVGGRWGYIAKLRDGHADDATSDVDAAEPVAAGIVDDAPADTSSTRAIDLRDPVSDDRVVLRYQPILDLATGQVAAVEALARMRRDDGALVAPTAFVAHWERAGHPGRLDEVVLPRALQDLLTLRAEPGYENLRVSVDVSPHRLGDDLVELVRTSLARFELSPDSLLLEITETAPLDTMDDALAVLRSLHALGVGVALTDFGTGFTRLDLIHDLPVDTVKVDSSFVRRVVESNVDHDIIETIVKMARRRGLTVVAEGVDSVEQIDPLTRLGCSQAQGYLFGRPADLEQLRYLLREWQIVPAIATVPTRGA